MIKELKNKRSNTVAELVKFRALIENEKRALTEDEQKKLDELNAQLVALKKQIADLEGIEAEEKEEAARSFKNTPTARSNDALASFISSRSGSFVMKGEEFFKRATITSATDSAFKVQNVSDNILIDAGETPLVAAIKPQFLPKGTLTVPLTKGLIGQIVVPGGSATDADPISTSLALAPKYYTVPVVVSDEFLYSSTDAAINRLIEDAKVGLFRRMEQRAFELFSGSTLIPTGQTAYKTVVDAEAAINGVGQYFLSSAATAKAKVTSVDSGSGVFVWNNGSVNGQPAHRAYLIGSNTKGFYVDPSKVVGAMWNEVTLQFIKDGDLARQGETMINVSIMADVNFDPSGVIRFVL